jgi:hypothetical protein
MNDLKAKQQLQDMCENIAQDITDGMTYQEAELDHEENGCEPGDPISAFDWLQDALDIQYIVTGSGEYLGARILVAFGGPNIWLNTQEQSVKGYWWGDRGTAHYMIDALGLDDALAELWECR